MTASGFRIARVPPLLGRPLVEDDESPGASAVVVIGHGIWRERFAESYAGMMEAAVSRTVERSEAYRRQLAETFERSLRAWNPLLAPRAPSSGEEGVGSPQRIAEALEALRAEVRALDAKLDRVAGSDRR